MGSIANGAIVRIKLENFMTYTFVEVRPGANLNVIVGTNGSGKSSLVCAICLGLCGTPHTVGRASNVSDYIRHGADYAVIEIELASTTGQNTIIERRITGSKSTWKVNGVTLPQKSVEHLVAKLNIQVSNLCQFLPQDRVADFVRMSRQELLEGTERAVGSSELFDLHQRLKELQQMRGTLEASLQGLKTRLEQERQKVSHLDAEVKKIQEHKEVQRRIERLRQKLAWMEYDEARHLFLEEKNKLRDEENKLKTKEQELAPLQSAVEKVSQWQANIAAVEKELKAGLAVDTKAVEASLQNFGLLADKFSSVKNELRRKIQEEEGRIERMQKYADEIAGFEREVAESSLVDIPAKVTEVQVKIQECNRDISSVSNEKATADEFIKDKQRESNAVVQEIKRLNDLSNQRLELLRRRSRDAYEATMWLQQNEGRFKGKIYPPIMTQIDLMNASDAKYVEAQIPLRDLLAFVAEYPEDLNSFLGTIRDSRNLRVNGVVVPAESLDSFKPRRPLSEIKRCGFRAYIKSLFSAPDGVMRYLCKRHRVHDIPVGDARTEDCLEEVRRLGMRRFFTRDNLYTIKVSQYDPSRIMTTCSEVSAPHLLTMSVDVTNLRKLEKQKQALAEEIAARTAEVKNLNAKDRTLQQQLEELRTAKKRWLNELSHIRQLNMLLEQKREALERLRNEAIDLDAEHRKAAAEQRKICSCRVKEARNFANKLQECHKKHREFAEHRLDMVKVLVDRKKAEEKLRVVQNEYCSLENRVKSMKEDLLRLKREAQSKLKEAQEATKCSSSTLTIPPDVAKEFLKLPNTAAEITKKLHEEEVKLSCMLPVDLSVESEHHQRKRDIEKLEADVKGNETQLSELETEMEDTRSRWLPNIEELLQRINVGFGRFFRALGCAGDVSLYQGEQAHQYDQFGVNIRVKFRDQEALAELSAAHQSGGERSVATVLYMMALQELTSVPFRCVDEINQGMDSENERRVFEMIMNTARQNSAQYFLLTPKLLPDLPYAENVTMIFISKCTSYIPDWNPQALVGRSIGLAACVQH